MYQLVSEVCVKVRRDGDGDWELDDSHGGAGCGEFPDWTMEKYADLPVRTGPSGSGKDAVCSTSVLVDAIPSLPKISVTIRSGDDPLVAYYADNGEAARYSFGKPVLWPFFVAIVAAVVGVLALAFTACAVVALVANVRATRFGEEHDADSSFFEAVGGGSPRLDNHFLLGGRDSMSPRSRRSNQGRSSAIVWDDE
jgi:hypothetical protein